MNAVQISPPVHTGTKVRFMGSRVLGSHKAAHVKVSKADYTGVGCHMRVL